MNESKRNRVAVIAAAAVAAITTQTPGADITWNDTDAPNSNWSDAANWSSATVPTTADAVFFGATGAAASAGTVTNVVDTSLSIDIFNSQARSDLGGFHNTQINAGVTLTVDGTGNLIFIGTQTDAGSTAQVYHTITGAGTLTTDSDDEVFMVRQGSATGGSQRATLDMAGLANFVLNQEDFHVGQGTASATPAGNRGTGTVVLALNNSITASDEIVVGQQVASSGGQSRLFLGGNGAAGGSNNLNTGEIVVGGRKGNGLVAFNADVVGGNLTIRGAGGGASRADLLLGTAQASEGTGTSSTGVIDLTVGSTFGSGTVDAMLGNVIIGRTTGTTGAGTGRITYDAGTINANSIALGTAGVTASTAVGTGTLEVKGTATLVVSNNIILANTLGGTSIPVGNLTIAGTGGGASAKVGGEILDAGGSSSVSVTNGSLTATRIGSALSPVDNLTVTDGTLKILLDTAAATANVTTLAAGGTAKLSLTLAGNITAGTYPVIDYGTVGGAFTLDKLPPRMVASLSDSGSTLDVMVTSFDSPKWIGNVSNNWNLATANWQLINGGTPTVYEENLAVYSTADNVLLNDDATTTDVNVEVNVAPGSIRFQNDIKAYTLTGTGAIGGTTPITKDGGNSVVLANTGGNAIGSIAVNAGTLQIGNNATAGGGLGSYGGIAVAGSATLTLAPAAGDSLALGGVISGAGVVNHTGAGATSITGTNTYTGQTNITNGAVVVGNSTALGAINGGQVVISGGGTLDVNNGSANNLNFFAGAVAKVFHISGTGVGGNGAIISSAVNKDTNPQNNAFNQIMLDADAAVGGTGRFDIRNNAAVLTLNGFTLTKKGTGQFSVVGTTVTDGNIVVEGGTLSLETSSTVAGSGTITYGPGTIGQFFRPTGAISRPMTVNSATLTDASQTQAVDIQSPLTFGGNNTIQINSSTGFTFSGGISENAPSGLSKTGAGKLVLGGTVAYTGPTLVSEGRVVVNNGLTSSASVTVENAAILEVPANGTSNNVIKTGTVTVVGTAKINLNDNKLITSTPLGTWDGSSAYAAGTVSGMVDAGRGSASNAQWDGIGIVTSDTRAVNNNDLVSIGTAAVSAIKNIDATATTVFAGQTVLGNDTIAMVTWGGDANLDGKINIDDYGQIDFNVGSSGSVFGWYNGDFNYDGKINIDDYGIIDFNVSAQDSIFPTGGGIEGVAAVPEPAGGLILLGLATAVPGRRRRCARSARR